MKNIVISADGDRMVYSVPDIVADNLEKYCLEFYTWLKTSPHAEKYRIQGVLYYNEADFIEYLNKWIFPGELSSFVENIGRIDSDNFLPEPYQYCPKFNF